MGKSMQTSKLPNERPGHLKSLVCRLWPVKGFYMYGHCLKEGLWKKSSEAESGEEMLQ